MLAHRLPTSPREVRKDAHEFTARAIMAGLAIGTLLCFSNCYFGLQVCGHHHLMCY
jgi:uncharacterized oligopeptide transporter (OPT) family protein